MRVFLFLHRAAGIVVGVHKFRRELFGHLALASLSRIDDEPADREGLTSFGPDLDGNLVVGAADTAGLDFHDGHNVFHRLLEDIHGIHVQFLPHDLKRVVNDCLGRAFFAVKHDLVDELCHYLASVHRIGQHVSFRDITSSGHVFILL